MKQPCKRRRKRKEALQKNSLHLLKKSVFVYIVHRLFYGCVVGMICICCVYVVCRCMLLYHVWIVNCIVWLVCEAM